jgi:hypothetical protein
LQEIFCPECGQKTRIDPEKKFCFCLQCGKKIERKREVSQEQSEYVEKKLEEVSFYYQTSRDKREDANYNEEPVYYLKAQDLLVDLQESYPDDYRIYWEMCKPIDFETVSLGADACGQYRINEDAFGKALDRADISAKKRMIEEHDRYLAEKKKVLDAAEERRKLEEAERKKQEEVRLRQEEERRQKDEQRQREEERRRQQEEIERQQKEEERQREQLRIQQEIVKKGEEDSEILWQALGSKDYSDIDNRFFEIAGEKGQTVIGVFKNVSNVMNLMAFHIDNGNAYRDQSLVIKFDDSGHGIKFDNSPIRMKGNLPQQGAMIITCDGMGGLKINGLELKQDKEYVLSLMKGAKKPMFAFTKYFY